MSFIVCRLKCRLETPIEIRGTPPSCNQRDKQKAMKNVTFTNVGSFNFIFRELTVKSTEVEMQAADDKQDDENSDMEEKIKVFLSELVEAGNSEMVAKAALNALGPDDIDEGVF